ncbi:signal peptidase I [Alkalicoccobacillus murimartini]|uniref:Signal peptidase I n=1 Tax=Alkalicoccobacillus murimartini TaxID=171685 RepID=A0ABT9YC03_9BACI|nr:signal peptidase I [Alkalicoccobacillus murimartini]MDQ0205256.1 signal peptidase I [Alkalicoccobacillus murimartini]
MSRTKSELLGWVKAIIIAIVLAVIIRTFLFTSYEVRGESMLPTAHEGELFIINKLNYQFSEPSHDDLIVFHATQNEDYIKRVIGLPGDTVRVESDVLYINDEAVDEPYLDEVKPGPGTYTQDFDEVTVPEGHVFVMGDNRPSSLDSRRIGAVSEDQIVGKVDLRFWPLSEFTYMGNK